MYVTSVMHCPVVRLMNVSYEMHTLSSRLHELMLHILRRNFLVKRLCFRLWRSMYGKHFFSLCDYVIKVILFYNQMLWWFSLLGSFFRKKPTFWSIFIWGVLIWCRKAAQGLLLLGELLLSIFRSESRCLHRLASACPKQISNMKPSSWKNKSNY